ncbi:MAG: hypothetical protein MJ074_07295 [Oscillospiraceae bacterium]|nr:hypothetical protein [Oscillospiraceae bacterium]
MEKINMDNIRRNNQVTRLKGIATQLHAARRFDDVEVLISLARFMEEREAMGDLLRALDKFCQEEYDLAKIVLIKTLLDPSGQG